jgi:two-component system response regulator QseB
MRILLVEDDQSLGEGLRAGLSQMGHTVDWSHDGLEGDEALLNHPFDVMILDLGLPGQPGLELLRRMRHRGDNLPVLILTARDKVSDRVQGLDMGADDFLSKPFDLDELAARLRALYRRREGTASPIIERGDLRLDPARHEVTLSGVAVPLSKREFALLHRFMDNPNRVLTKSQLEESLYGWEGAADSNTVEVFIYRLRRKLGAEQIQTIRGVGYMMTEQK